MRYFKLTIPALLMLLVISCGNMDGQGNGDGNGNGSEAPKQFKTATEAASAAKDDMLSAMDKVDFGVSREQLKNAAPGTPVAKYDINWNSLLSADSNLSPETMTEPEAVTMVPLENSGNVVAMVALSAKNQQFSIAELGNRQITSELDMVKKADSNGQQGEIRIYVVPNLQATIYAVGQGERSIYYTSYNNNSIRQGMNGPELFKMIKAEAMQFQRQYGDELKKGKLAR